MGVTAIASIVNASNVDLCVLNVENKADTPDTPNIKAPGTEIAKGNTWYPVPNRPAMWIPWAGPAIDFPAHHIQFTDTNGAQAFCVWQSNRPEDHADKVRYSTACVWAPTGNWVNGVSVVNGDRDATITGNWPNLTISLANHVAVTPPNYLDPAPVIFGYTGPAFPFSPQPGMIHHSYVKPGALVTGVTNTSTDQQGNPIDVYVSRTDTLPDTLIPGGQTSHIWDGQNVIDPPGWWIMSITTYNGIGGLGLSIQY